MQPTIAFSSKSESFYCKGPNSISIQHMPLVFLHRKSPSAPACLCVLSQPPTRLGAMPFILPNSKDRHRDPLQGVGEVIKEQVLILSAAWASSL